MNLVPLAFRVTPETPKKSAIVIERRVENTRKKKTTRRNLIACYFRSHQKSVVLDVLRETGGGAPAAYLRVNLEQVVVLGVGREQIGDADDGAAERPAVLNAALVLLLPGGHSPCAQKKQEMHFCQSYAPECVATHLF